MPMNVDKVLGTQVFLKSAAAAFVHRTVAQKLVTIGAVRQVLFQCDVNIMHLFEMVLNGLLRSKITVAILTVCHGVVGSF